VRAFAASADSSAGTRLDALALYPESLPNVNFKADTLAPPEARIGQTLSGKWRIDGVLDVGGMAAVYVATHRNGRKCAIKILHARFARDPEVRRRFLREGYVANKIDHPGAVAILDDDTTEDGAPFLVMELLDGQSLAAWLTRAGGSLPALEVLGIAGQVLEVLEVAHANGVIHRDLKPGNVFVTKTGHAKLLDFGLARIRDGSASIVPTAAGVVLGTAGYMSPEQARGAPDQVDARSDIFAVGAVMFRALTGRRVHEKQSAFDVMLAAMKEQAPSLRGVMPGAGPLLVAAVDKALAFDKAARWQTAREMREALHSAYEESRERASVPTEPPPLSSVPPQSIPLELSFASLISSTDEPSLVIDVAFGDRHDEKIASERQRTRELAEGLTGKPAATKEDRD
jgi:serine/threonine protein kinase